MPRFCSDLPPAELLQGIDQFNAGEWFACHETLEELWAGEQGDARHLYQGILQVAVALHHWREGNFRGAMVLLGSAEELLTCVEPVCQGIDVAALRQDTGRLREALEALGPEGMGELDPAVIPQFRLRSG
ncbi:hypothetical protein RHDC3_02889 [Rhodocyclaceae bacterium]|nr:hypothetical protein RHDC3_02889 [Rhodocyclaceae bacterium]